MSSEYRALLMLNPSHPGYRYVELNHDYFANQLKRLGLDDAINKANRDYHRGRISIDECECECAYMAILSSLR